jgi:hypothetical protein
MIGRGNMPAKPHNVMLHSHLDMTTVNAIIEMVRQVNCMGEKRAWAGPAA